MNSEETVIILKKNIYSTEYSTAVSFWVPECHFLQPLLPPCNLPIHVSRVDGNVTAAFAHADYLCRTVTNRAGTSAAPKLSQTHTRQHCQRFSLGQSRWPRRHLGQHWLSVVCIFCTLTIIEDSRHQTMVVGSFAVVGPLWYKHDFVPLFKMSLSQMLLCINRS